MSRWRPDAVRAHAALLVACLLAACGRGEPSNSGPPVPLVPAFVSGPGLAGGLQATADDALPVPAPDDHEEVAELLDAASVGGAVGRRAQTRLDETDARRVAAVLLTLVEDRDTPLPLRRAAYARLRSHGTPGVVPRLTLRLKYEKDSWSAVCAADTLLAHGNGAGLDALAAVLERDPANADDEAARSYAAQIIQRLPAVEGWEPGADFAADWQRLGAVRALWTRERRLDAAAAQREALHPEIEAELWRIATRLRSQPLRPVDDARFVLIRQRGAVVPLLLQAAADEDRYVREHALQTLSWMGLPVHHWCHDQDWPYVERVASLLGDAGMRARCLEALGAGGLPAAAAHLRPWVLAGTRDESVAAADALLRCAEDDTLPWLRTTLDHEPNADRLAPAALYSLWSLRAELDLGAGVAVPDAVVAALPESERARRDRWRDERALRALD